MMTIVVIQIQSQLVQSILKIGSAEIQGEGGGCHSTWQLVVVVVNTRWSIFQLSCAKECTKCSFQFVGTPFLAL